MNLQRREISEDSQTQKRKGKRLEREVQKLTMQMKPMMMKYFSSTNDISEILVTLRKLQAKVAAITTCWTNGISSTNVRQFDDFEKDRKKKQEIINNLKEEISILKGRIDKELYISSRIRRKGRGHRRLGCWFFMKDNMGIDLLVNGIDRTQLIGKPSPQKKRPIIVQFVRYIDRRKVFSNKKKLKDFGIFITESLTARRIEELSKSRNEHGFKNVYLHVGWISLAKHVTSMGLRTCNCTSDGGT